MHFACLARLLELIGHNHIRPIYIVSHDLCSNYSSNYSPSMDADSHIKAIQGRLFLLHFLDLLQHIEGKGHNILGLFDWITVIAIRKA